MNINDEKKLREEDLQSVSGGIGGDDNSICCFTHTSGNAPIRKRATGESEAECGAGFCGPHCLCYNTDCCVNRWHIVTVNGSPLPRDKHEKWYK